MIESEKIIQILYVPPTDNHAIYSVGSIYGLSNYGRLYLMLSDSDGRYWHDEEVRCHELSDCEKDIKKLIV